jgi:protein ImuB
MRTASTPNRYLSLWLRCLSTDRLRRKSAAPDDALVVAGLRDNALRIVALDDAAAALGLRHGMPLADARAMHPGLCVAEDDARADGELLASICDWCLRWTPLAALDPPDGIFLDISGCAHLFGGEAGLLADVLHRFARIGFHARAAIADSAGAAWALARYGDEAGTIVAPDCAREAIEPLPLAALRLDAETVSALASVGLKRVADILDLPRAPLAARFGAGLIERLERALGRLEEPISPRLPVAPYVAERSFPEPIGRIEDIESITLTLARRLQPMLERRGEGARRLELCLFRTDGAVKRVEAGASRPLRDPDQIAALFAERFAALSDELDPGFGFDLVRLSALSAEAAPAVARQFGESAEEEDLARLVDRLGARLGLNRVQRIVAGNTWLPEQAAATAPAHCTMPDAIGWSVPDLDTPAPVRPLRLFERPEPIDAVAEVPDGPPVRFRWRRALHQVVRAEGPERIAPAWWSAGPKPTRDYYRVEDEAGQRFWLYREGLYALEAAYPRWFLHGLFA